MAKKSFKDPKAKKFRKQGGSFIIAIKDMTFCMDVNDQDDYVIEYFEDKVVITKKKEV